MEEIAERLYDRLFNELASICPSSPSRGEVIVWERSETILWKCLLVHHLLYHRLNFFSIGLAEIITVTSVCRTMIPGSDRSWRHI